MVVVDTMVVVVDVPAIDASVVGVFDVSAVGVVVSTIVGIVGLVDASVVGIISSTVIGAVGASVDVPFAGSVGPGGAIGSRISVAMSICSNALIHCTILTLTLAIFITISYTTIQTYLNKDKSSVLLTATRKLKRCRGKVQK